VVKVYLAGPMTGIANFNFPEFDRVSADLRKKGFEVVSPAELDSPEARRAALKSPDGDPSHYAEGESWGDCLARDVKLIADEDIEAIVVLPNWGKSRGAKLETFVGRLCGVPILRYPDLEPVSDKVIGSVHSLPPGVDTVDNGCVPVNMPEYYIGEVRVVNNVTGGEKGRKPEQYSLLPWEQLAEVARLYARGAEKYERYNWTKGYDWSLSFDSLIRHATQWWNGDQIDAETQCDHMASVIFHALALIYFSKHHAELDDRPRVSCPT
jgi:Domain of unknown function (DUF5664)/Domain of unknown function (DUF4406)